MEMDNYKKGIMDIAKDLEEATTYCFKGHYNSSSIWTYINRALAIIAAVLATIASISAFKDSTVLSGILSIFVTLISASIAILNPLKNANDHKNAGDDFLALNRKIKMFRKIDFFKMSENDARKNIDIFDNNYKKLTKESPVVCSLAYKRAKKNIEEGGNEYKTDKEGLK